VVTIWGALLTILVALFSLVFVLQKRKDVT
jgi:hypothetical protein